MPAPDQEYRSLMLRKAQLLANEHGGIANIPREVQKKLGFDVIAKRKGFSISVRIPEGNLEGRIQHLRTELPAEKEFGKSKPEPDPFGKYTPIISEENPTMEDFWIMQGWYKEDRVGIRLTKAEWKYDETVRNQAVMFLVEKALKKEPRDITADEFFSNRLSGLLTEYYNCSPYAALLEAGYAYSIEEALQHSKEGVFQTEKIYPWEMSKTPDWFYDSRENLIAATKWLAQKLQKDPRDATAEDFFSNRLGGLLNHYYNSSPYAALLEAGLVTPEDEPYMKRSGVARFTEI